MTEHVRSSADRVKVFTKSDLDSLEREYAEWMAAHPDIEVLTSKFVVTPALGRTTPAASFIVLFYRQLDGAETAESPEDALRDGVIKRAMSLRGDSNSIMARVTHEVKRELILWALKEMGGNTTRAATLLGVSSRALFYKKGEYGIE